MHGQLHIRIAGRDFHLSALALLMTVIGIGYLGQVLLQGGLRSGPGGIAGLGGVGILECWAAGGSGPRALFERGEWWRLASHVFLHGSVLHLLMNGWALFQLGRVTELIYGGVGLLITFLVAGFAGGFASCAWHAWRSEPAIAVGASGAICGLLGLLLAHMRSRRDIMAQHIGRTLGTWAVIMLVFGLIVPRIDNAAHIGGFVAGYLLARVLRTGHFLHMLRGWARWRGPGLALLLTVVTAVALLIAGLGARERLRDLTAAVNLSGRIEIAVGVLQGRQKGTTIQDQIRAIAAVPAGPRFRADQSEAISLLEDPKAVHRPTTVLQQIANRLQVIAVRMAPDLARPRLR